MYPNALVMLADDERDASVLSALESCAEKLGVQTILLVHVALTDPLPRGLLAGIHLPDPPPPAALQEAVERLNAALPGVKVEGKHAVGAPAEVLDDLAKARDIDLLVMGRASASQDGEPAWGPHGRHLLQTALCSMLVVPMGAMLKLDEVVVGLDFSRLAGESLLVGATIADHVVALCQYNTAAAAAGSITDDEFTTHLLEAAHRHFDKDLAPMLGNLPRPTLELATGDRASDVLIDRAGERLLIVGSRGLSRLALMLLGSTAERLAGRSIGPVLIVRRKGEVMGVLEGLVHR